MFNVSYDDSANSVEEFLLWFRGWGRAYSCRIFCKHSKSAKRGGKLGETCFSINHRACRSTPWSHSSKGSDWTLTYELRYKRCKGNGDKPSGAGYRMYGLMTMMTTLITRRYSDAGVDYWARCRGLVHVYQYRYLSVSQIEALHFPSLQTAYRRLRALTAGNYLKSFTVPGIAERVFYLNKYQGGSSRRGNVCWPSIPLNGLESASYQRIIVFSAIFSQLTTSVLLWPLPVRIIQLPSWLYPWIYWGENNRGDVKKYLRDNVCDVRRNTTINSLIHLMARSLLKKRERRHFFRWNWPGGWGGEWSTKGRIKINCVLYELLGGEKVYRYEQDFEREFKVFRALYYYAIPPNGFKTYGRR